MEVGGHQRLQVKKRLDPLAVASGRSVQQRTGEGQGLERGDQLRACSSLGERAVAAAGTGEVAVEMAREEGERTKGDLFRTQARCDGLHSSGLLVGRGRAQRSGCKP